ncbi:MAG: response regulator [Deltaproteobacteria bacterium]|nr:response regulator [Deltaproteobacteria bacterium]
MNDTPSKTILIIDDEYYVRDSIAAYLYDVGYRVLMAENGLIGLETFHRELPDVVLTDLRMPVMDGFAVVESVRDGAPYTPIVVVSGLGDLDEAIRALSLGAWDYISKPIINFEELKITMERVLDRARLLLEVRDHQQNLEKLVEERTRQVQVTQSRLIQAHKLASIGMLASGIAHEINNPNNYIAFNTDLLTEIWRDALPVLAAHAELHPDFTLSGLPFDEIPVTTERLLAGLADGSRRINTIVSQLKQYARPGADVCPSGFDINRAVSNAVALLDHHIHRQTDAFRLDAGNDLPPVHGSMQQIEQVLINLIANSLQAISARDQSVVVSTSFDSGNGEVVVVVADQGCGMNTETLARLKEPFFSTRHEDGGTGLGISISDSIVHEQGGALAFESEPGKGTRAIVRLKTMSLKRSGI